MAKLDCNKTDEMGGVDGLIDTSRTTQHVVAENRPAELGLRLAPFAERIGSALQTVIHEALVLDEIDAQAGGEEHRAGRLRDACQGLWQASTAISDALMSLEAERFGHVAETA